PFHTRLELLEYQPRYIPARSGKAGNYAASDRVAHHRYYDGNRGCGLPCAPRSRGPVGDDDVDLQTNKLSCQSWQAVQLSLCPAIFEDQVSAFHVSEFAETLP